MTKFSNETAHWLDWQCRMISDVKRGGVFLASRSADSHLEAQALWPDLNGISPALESIAEKTVKDGAGITQKRVNDGSDVLDYVAYPLIQKNGVVGAVVLAIATRSDQQRQAVLLLLQWGAAFMEKILERGDNEHPQAATLALNAVAFLSRNEPLAVAGYHLCNLLADSFDCSRVVFGLRSGLQVRALSMSHQLQFDRRIVRVSQIEFAMEECIEQHQNIILPASSAQTMALLQPMRNSC